MPCRVVPKGGSGGQPTLPDGRVVDEVAQRGGNVGKPAAKDDKIVNWNAQHGGYGPQSQAICKGGLEIGMSGGAELVDQGVRLGGNCLGHLCLHPGGRKEGVKWLAKPALSWPICAEHSDAQRLFEQGIWRRRRERCAVEE